MTIDQNQYVVAMAVDTETGKAMPKTAATLTGSNQQQDGMSTPQFIGFNGVTWDRWRNNADAVALARAVRTGTTVSPNIINYNARALMVYFNIYTASGTGGLILKVRGVDPVSNASYNLNADIPASSTISVARYAYVIGLGATGGGGAVQDFRQATAVPIPKTFQIQVYHADASNYEYAVSYSIIV